MNINEIKEMLKEKSIDPLLIAIGSKGYEWIIGNESSEEEASDFEQYILISTTKEELEEIRNKRKSLRDFIMWKYINHLEVLDKR